jgi:hypothetical protein
MKAQQVFIHAKLKTVDTITPTFMISARMFGDNSTIFLSQKKKRRL